MRFFGQFCFGCVRVRLSGASPERFFNLCGSADIEIWDVSFVQGEYEFFIKIKDFFSCRPFAKKSKVRLRIIKKFGLPFFLHKNKNRKLWAVGFFSFFIFLYVLSLFVWDINYKGNVTYTDDVLEHYLETLDVSCGIRKKTISCEELEAALRNEFEGITWVSARLSGTRLYIHIKENEVMLEIPIKDETPGDLIAAYDGMISSIVVRSGIAMVKAGDMVEKGQVLVSGRIPITNDGEEVVAEHYVRSDADITGIVKHTETKEINLWHRRDEPTGRKRKGLMVNAFDKSFVWLLPNFRNTEWKTVTETKKLCLFGDFYLPLQYGLITSVEVSPYDEKYSESELSAMAEEYKNEVSEKMVEKGVQIIENNVRILMNGSKCRFEVELLAEESMEERSTVN